MIKLTKLLTIFTMIVLFPISAETKETYIPILVPITGFLSLEGTAQRNGAIQALDEASSSLKIKYEVSDTSTSPEIAVTALQRALSRGKPVAIAAPIFGTQMLAMLPIAKRAGVPLITVSVLQNLRNLTTRLSFGFSPAML